MNKAHLATLAALFAATLTACGGGGSDLPGVTVTPTPVPSPPPAPAPAPAPSSNPTPGAAPTAALVDSPSTASALADEAKAAIDAAIQKSQAPGGINLASVPAGATTTIACGVSGSISYETPTTFGTGTTYSYTYNNCSYAAGYSFNGSYVITYNNYASANNFTWTITYNITTTGYNFSYSGSQTCTYNNGAYSCTFSDSGRTFETSFTYANGVLNGSYQWTYGTRGTLRYVFTNWGATSGTIQVSGANGSSATIVRNSATTYTVTINGGTPYTVMP